MSNEWIDKADLKIHINERLEIAKVMKRESDRLLGRSHAIIEEMALLKKEFEINKQG